MSNHNTESHADGSIASSSALDPQLDPVTDDPDLSDSSLEELQDDDFPAYFSEINGRLYTSSAIAPYRLPVDTPEQERCSANHNILRRFIGTTYQAVAANALAPQATEPRKALDLCCGNGKWLLEMAAQSPHAQFVGVDIVPIATRYPPDNVQFELGDVNTRLRWADRQFDLIHARDILMCTRDYGALLDETARLLCPGGLFIGVEWSNHAELHPSMPGTVEEVAPVSMLFFATLDHYLADLGVNIDGSIIEHRVRDCAHFTGVVSQQVYVPIGACPWNPTEDMQRVGSSFKVALKRMAVGFRRLFLDSGMSGDEFDSLIEDFVEEMREVAGLVMVVNITCAQRV